MIETHAHIYSKKFKDDIDEVLEKCKEEGIQKIYMPNVDEKSIDPMMELEEKYPGYCYSTMGLHPCSVDKDFEKSLYIVEDWLSKRPFLAVGEMGIDLYWDKTFLEQQMEAFKIQADLAVKYNIPLIIHVRDAMPETLNLLEEINRDGLTGVVHCFTGNVEDAKRILDLGGFYLGIGGVATFVNGGLDKVIPSLPLDKLVLETDSPYLAPKPYRGKRNAPFYLPVIRDRVADLLEVLPEEVERVTTENALNLFEKGV